MDYVLWRNIQKRTPPHIKSLCGTWSKRSNPVGIGLGIEYVRWRNMQQWIPPHAIFMWDTEKIPNPMGIG